MKLPIKNHCNWKEVIADIDSHLLEIENDVDMDSVIEMWLEDNEAESTNGRTSLARVQTGGLGLKRASNNTASWDAEVASMKSHVSTVLRSIR